MCSMKETFLRWHQEDFQTITCRWHTPKDNGISHSLPLTRCFPDPLYVINWLVNLPSVLRRGRRLLCPFYRGKTEVPRNELRSSNHSCSKVQRSQYLDIAV